MRKWWNGIHTSLRGWRPQGHGGSNPPSRTMKEPDKIIYVLHETDSDQHVYSSATSYGGSRRCPLNWGMAGGDTILEHGDLGEFLQAFIAEQQAKMDAAITAITKYGDTIESSRASISAATASFKRLAANAERQLAAIQYDGTNPCADLI